MATETDPQLARAIAEVSEKAATLVREEIELAKAEVSLKVKKLAAGIAVALAAGVFVAAALVMFLFGLSYVFLDFVFHDDVSLGFFIVMGILLALGAVAGLVAFRAVRGFSSPKPELAIEEARKIRETLTARSSDGGGG